MTVESTPFVVAPGQTVASAVYDSLGLNWAGFRATASADQAGTLVVQSSVAATGPWTTRSTANHSSVAPAPATGVSTDRFWRALWTNGGNRPTSAFQMETAGVTDTGAMGWQGAWAAGITYGRTAVVTGTDLHCYMSKAALNLGNNPVGDAGVHWQPLAS